MAGPRSRPKNLSGNSSKASRLPQTKKKSKTKVDSFGTSIVSNESNDGKGGDKKAGSKKSQRSILGFIVGTVSCAALWGWSIMNGVSQRRRDRAILDGMRRRPLAITEHAACRMDCRFVTRAEVQKTLRNGRINSRKSDRTSKPCPKYVVDADIDVNSRLKKVQSVFAACPTETRLITVIDNSTNWPCGPC